MEGRVGNVLGKRSDPSDLLPDPTRSFEDCDWVVEPVLDTLSDRL